MEAAKRAVGLSDVQWITRLRQDQMESYTKVVNDSDKEARLKKGECPICFYIAGRIGGQAFTTAWCGICEAEMVFGNTNVDKLCPACATKHRLCRHCGADVNLKKRQKL